MTNIQKSKALQEIQDMQDHIESLEDEWNKAFNAGESTEKIDSEIDRFLHIRNGMEMMLTAIGIKVDRRDYRMVDLDKKSKLHTIWYLV